MIYLPIHLLFEWLIRDVLNPTCVPIDAAWIQDCYRQVGERGRQLRLPIDSSSHLDVAGKEHGGAPGSGSAVVAGILVLLHQLRACASQAYRDLVGLRTFDLP